MRRVVEPLLSGAGASRHHAHDLEYVRDLGLVARDGPLRIANPIYAEVVPRELTCAVQTGLVQDPAWYVDAKGGLDVDRLMTAFQSFFREHSEHWMGRFDYAEAGPQLILQAFLQRVVNGGGRIEREYGLGRGRTDLLIVWPREGGGAPEPGAARFVIECKVLRKGLERTIREGLKQTAGLHGPLRGAGRPPRGLRPHRGTAVGGEDLPPRRTPRPPRHHRVGDVTTTADDLPSVSETPISPLTCREGWPASK